VLFRNSGPAIAARRVVITGAGIVTALGSDWISNADGFRAGRTAFREITLFDVSRQRVKFAAEIPFSLFCWPIKLGRRREQRLDRAAKLLLNATQQALEQANWESHHNVPIVLGTTSGGMSLGEAYYRQAVSTPAGRKGQRSRVLNYQAQRQGLDIADAFGIRGPIYVIANACASGANAIGHGWSLIRNGNADRVLVGGYDALSHLVFSGFDSLQALSPTTCRPFDADRDGLALGEGASVFTLESLSAAEQRGATILGEIVGYGASTDIHHLTQPHPKGDAAFEAMSEACRIAGVSADQIQYLNAHGTGTPLNDSAEAIAINRWAGSASSNLLVSSTKASVGHLLGAAGAVEAAVCLMALQGQWVPPTSTLRTVDPVAGFRMVREPMEAKLHYVMSNSFGFGGANASLLMRRWT
jgi:3-oxoacyl-[acyl-carrier-protein] synthase II